MRLMLLLSVLLFAACHAPQPPVALAPDPLARFEGNWIRRGPYTPVHSGTDQVWCIERLDGAWTIRSITIHHPGINHRDEPLTRSDEQPVPLTWSDGALEFSHPRSVGRAQRITADMRDDQLLLPAVLQRDERTWEYQGWRHDGVFQCEGDPSLVHEGAATLSDPCWPGRPSTYRVCERASLAGDGHQVRVIEFLQRASDDVGDICAEVYCDPGVGSAYIHLPRTSVWLNGEPHERLSAEDWAAVLVLPTRATR